MKVLFVCLGNICRSPSAEAVFRARIPKHEFDSAGTGSWHVGEAPDERAIAEGARRGYDLSPLRARQFVREDFDRFDVIYVMDHENLRAVEALRPKENVTPVRLLLSLSGGGEVPDPYYDNRFAHVFHLIETASDEYINRYV